MHSPIDVFCFLENNCYLKEILLFQIPQKYTGGQLLTLVLLLFVLNKLDKYWKPLSSIWCLYNLR